MNDCLHTLIPAHGHVNGDGVQLAFHYWPGRGTPVVCLHGLTASSLSFVGLADSLAGQQAVWSLDLRGRGNSDKPAAPYGMAQHARDVAAALRVFGAESYIVVGHSMGAYVATALAAQEPDLVAGLVMLDGGYFLPMPADVSAEQVLYLVVGPAVIGRLQQTFPSHEAYLEYWRGLPAYPSAEWNAWLATYLAYDLGGVAPHLQPKGSAVAVRADFADMLRRDEVTARLQAVRCPTLVIRAAQGMVPGQPGILPEVVMQAISELVPHAQTHTIHDVTHYTILFNPHGVAQVASLLAEFRQQCRG
ncbi:MAG TPA: alpha/beta hydrolase [Blastocatellia bacterium]|nr:alpha/beta hydrolase [Blastocatellia bacterium]